MTYATFGQRFLAMWIDFLILLPVMLLCGWLAHYSYSKTQIFMLLVLTHTSYHLYTIYYHGRCGQTIGKRTMGIRVVRTDGERIGWREAWLRSSVDVIFSSLGALSLFVALATIPDAEYYGVNRMRREMNLAAHEPARLAWTSTASLMWGWSELVVMLFNERRRALHDFIAGTVVTSVRKSADETVEASF